jgi:hypothetical protein
MNRSLFGERRIVLFNSVLPVVSFVVAVWGSTWGWDVDGRLWPSALIYVVSAYVVYLLPYAVLKLRVVKDFANWFWGRFGRDGFLMLLWGLHLVVGSIGLIHALDSNAFWLGSMATFYVGFIVAVLGVIRLLV